MSALYETIAGRFARSIQEGVLRSGERLPSLRSLCRSEGVSLMTALAAYQRLESLRLVEALPRSGFRVLPRDVPALSGPAVPRPRVAAHSSERDASVSEVLAAVGDPSLVPLGLGCPSPDLYPLAALRRISGGLLASRPELWTTYSPAPGHPGLRRLIAQRLRARSLDVQEHEVLLTSGGMEALSLALRLLVRPGDAVLMECPTFFGLLDAARAVGARVIEVPGDPEAGVDPARLQAIVRRHRVRAAVLIPSFANPTGSLMPEQRKRLWAAALRKHGVALVEDDLYGELSFDHRKPVPLSAFARAEGTPFVLVGSLSKTLLPGARVGYLVARTPHMERAIALKQSTTLANVTLTEHLAAECLASGLLDRHLRKLVTRLETNLLAMRAGVQESFPSGTRTTRPRGGLSLWVELPHGYSGWKLFHAARESGISIAPGRIFTLGPGLERFFRLNAGASSKIDDAVSRLGTVAKTNAALPATAAVPGSAARSRGPCP